MFNILLINKDKLFNEFFKQLLTIKEFKVETVINGGFALNKLLNFKPDLIISTKEIPNLSLEGFLLKKKIIKDIANAPIFLIGDFTSQELLDFKKQNVKAFVSYPINPFALIERINIQFNIPNTVGKNQTPMLSDINVKGNIIIIQIEANLEIDKLILINYKIRAYCHNKNISKPKFLFVFPSLYPETVTEDNLSLLFDFLNFPELNISSRNIKILTKNQILINQLKKNPVFSEFEIVPDYLYAVNTLNVDLDKVKKIPIEFLKDGMSCILDLYDNDGHVRIPAYSVIKQEMVDYFLKTGEKSFSYFSDKPIDQLLALSKNIVSSDSLIDKLSSIVLDYESLEKYSDIMDIADDKMSLFYRKLKEFYSLIISNNKEDIEVIKNTFEQFLNIDCSSRVDVNDYMERKKCILIFLDSELGNPNPMEVLYQIRQKASRRKVTVIILAKKINKMLLSQYKQYGTDYIIISPLTTSKLLKKVFFYINNDRLS